MNIKKRGCGRMLSSLVLRIIAGGYYSHSIVAGGFDEMS